MSELFAARSQMALSLGFHIIFACVGIGMPLLMVIAERRWLKTRDPVYLELAKRWSKGTAIMFGVGAVSGTVLSFELGLLWPDFMAFAGPVIGLPFALEGFAFFLEAIFLGIYLYGWKRVPKRVHWLAGVGVLISGAASGIFVVTANAWMNTPAGFTVGPDGLPADIRPWEAMLNPAALSQTLHMTCAAFASIGFAVAGIHAYVLRRRPDDGFHRRALRIALPVAMVFSVTMLVTGDMSAKHIAEHQPAKLAAAEGHWETERGAPIKLLGWPDEEAEETRYSIDIPYVLSLLAFNDPNAEVMGLKDVPKDERPPVAPVHIAFQIMVGAGMLMLATALVGAWLWWRRKELPTRRWYLGLLALCTPLGFIAVEAGWTVTEVGRQPWVVHGVMRTSEAVTPMPHLQVPLLAMTGLYAVLGVVVIVLMRRMVFSAPTEQDTEDSRAAA